jgi:hypothetical protein
MPVRRFRTVADMSAPIWRQPGDPALYRAIAALWRSGQRTVAPRFPPGVYRHRSIEELNDQTEHWAAANFRAFQLRRHST